MTQPVVHAGRVFSAGSVFDAAGVEGCAGTPTVCSSLWTIEDFHPNVVAWSGKIYIADSFGARAYDASGVDGCSGTPKVCAPVWSFPIAGCGALVCGSSPPVVAGGRVYAVFYEGDEAGRSGSIYAVDAAGEEGCSGTPAVCTPLWTANGVTHGPIGSPAVLDGRLFIRDFRPGNLFLMTPPMSTVKAFDVGACALGTCEAIWSAELEGQNDNPGLAVAHGQVFVTADLPTGPWSVHAFDAAGVDGCSGDPVLCTPTWSAPGPRRFTPSVVGDVVFAGNANPGGSLYAFDVDGAVGCSGTPTTCSPLWQSSGIWPGTVTSHDGRLYVTGSVLRVFEQPA
jgi:outer membrane protein assembly factor BamB